MQTNDDLQIVVEVAVIDDCRVQRSSVLLHDFVRLLRDHTCRLTILWVDCKLLVKRLLNTGLTYYTRTDL